MIRRGRGVPSLRIEMFEVVETLFDLAVESRKLCCVRSPLEFNGDTFDRGAAAFAAVFYQTADARNCVGF